MSRAQLVYCLLALCVAGCQAGDKLVIKTQLIDLNGNDDGCNGVPHGIPCCEEGIVVGDNAGDEEMFIQADEYISSCIHTCKSLYPRSVGITKSRSQQYSSGPGRNKNKCWCEFGRGKLDSNNEGYKTCMFEELSNSEVSLPSNVSATAEGAPPKYIMVVTSCEPVPVETKDPYFRGVQVMFTRCETDKKQPQKIGRYSLQPESYNNFPVWKKDHRSGSLHTDQYLFMSDGQHWVIGPSVNASLFGILSQERPAPLLPHLAGGWMFWDGHQWIEDNSIKVMAGEKKDVGEDREMIMLDFKSVDVGNVNDSSHCCRACKRRDVVTDKALNTAQTVLFNYDKQKKRCSCFNTIHYENWNFKVERHALTHFNSEIKSGICDTYIDSEQRRRSGIWDVWDHHPTYHYSEVQGPLGEGRAFILENVKILGSLFLEETSSPLHPSSCCKECRKKYNDTEIFTYHGKKYLGNNIYVDKERFVECRCQKVETGTRPVTDGMSSSYYSGICDDIGPPVDCEVSFWNSWTECSNLRKTCGRGFRSRYAIIKQVARRGGKQCEGLDEEQSCEVEHCPPT